MEIFLVKCVYEGDIRVYTGDVGDVKVILREHQHCEEYLKWL